MNVVSIRGNSIKICDHSCLREGEEMIDGELLKILACPLCKSDVVLDNSKIVCTNCKRKYPIKDGIPVMLIEEAEAEAEEDRR